ncbi:MAG: tetratricopeptide repeat protein [Candidatus Hermodarchaeota archaeon]
MKSNKPSQNLGNIDKLILNSITLVKAREFNKALSILDDLLKEKAIQMNLIQEFGVRIAKLVSLMALKKYEQVNQEIKLSEEIINQMDEKVKENSLVKDGIGRLFSIKGGFYSIQGDLENAIVNLNHSIAVYEALNDKKSIFYQLEALGWVKRAQGKLDEALIYFHKMLDLAKEISSERHIARAEFSVAFTNFYKGDLDQATEYAQQCLVLYKKLNHFRGLLSVYSTFGSIYRGKGEFEKSLECYHKVLTIHNKNLNIQQGVSHFYCYAHRNIGWIYYYKNKIEKSIEYLREAAKAHRTLCESNNTIFDYDLIIIYLLLVQSAIEAKDFNQIEDSMKEISEFASKWPWINFFKRFGEAIILKSKQRAKYRFQAQQIFEEILETKFDYQIEFMIRTNLCDLLLDELKYSGDEEILSEIQDLLNKISDIATKQRSITTLIDAYSLQAKLALIEGNAELSRKLLTNALKIAENKGLELLTKKLIIQQNQLFNQLEEWRALFIRNSKLQERIEFLNLKRYVTKAINEVLEKKFTPQMVEEKVTVHKEIKSCLVCKGEVERFNIYICPKCNSIYCNNCAQTLTNLENACWVCNAPIDALKPIIPIKKEGQELNIKISKKPEKPSKKDKSLSKE